MSEFIATILAVGLGMALCFGIISVIAWIADIICDIRQAIRDIDSLRSEVRKLKQGE
jgi:hypothetical protein